MFRGCQFLRKKATGCILGLSPNRCDSIALTPVSEASTSTVKGYSGSGCLRIGADLKATLSPSKALSASKVHVNFLGPFFNRDDKGAAMVLKFQMKRQ